MQNVQRFLLINDLFIFSLLILFFIGFLIYDYELTGIKEPFIPNPISKDYKVFFEILPIILFSLLLIDLLIKYKLADKKFRYFVKKYWTDILMTVLLPILFPLKYFNATFKIYKYIKFAKSGFKLAQKYDKLFKVKK
jgi:hypothetical protein